MRTQLLKWVADVRYGLGQPPPTATEGIPILRATNIERGRIRSEGMIFARLEDLSRDRAPLLRSGEILVVRSGAYTGDSALVTPEWEGSAPGYDLRLTPRSIDPRFLGYQMLSSFVLDQIALASMRAAQPHLNAEDLGGCRVFTASASEERDIADYLDHETAAIEALIDQKRRLVALLEESVLARAYQALSQGLGYTALRPADLQWLPTVPSHWTVEPLRARYSVQLGKMLNPHASGGVDLAPYLRNVNVQWDRVDVSDLNEMGFDDEERARLSLRLGDLLVCEGGEVGRTAIWRGELDLCYFQKAVHRLRRRGQADVPRYLYYVMRVAASAGAFRAGGNRSTIVHLTKEKLQAHRFPFPPPAEQAEIVAALDHANGEAARLLELLERQVSKLRERRAALITAAVTGQLAVTAAA